MRKAPYFTKYTEGQTLTPSRLSTPTHTQIDGARLLTLRATLGLLTLNAGAVASQVTPTRASTVDAPSPDPVMIINHAWNHLWLDSEDTRELGQELIVLNRAMKTVKGRI